jgi:hypothetical protein
MSVLCLDDSDTHLSGHYSCVCHVTVEGTDATLLVAGSSSLALDKKPALRIPRPGDEELTGWRASGKWFGCKNGAVPGRAY